ncbi:MAG: hypothetical protein ACSLFN_06410 [Candidatus Limnocylindrales bacterium]
MSDDALRSALRTVTQARLVGLGIPAFAVGRWCRAWEREAARRGSEPGAPYWEDGIRWILAQVAEGRQPPEL